MTLSSALTMDKHSSKICLAGIYRLRQMWCVWRSLDSESVATLVYAFVTSCIHYCNVLLADTPKATTDKLQRLLNAAARLGRDTRKFDRSLRQLMHVDLHWLDVPERVKFKLVSTVHNCLRRKASGRLLHSNFWCVQLTTSSFCQASLPRCASTQSQLVWPSGICCCQPNCLELTEWWSTWYDIQYWQFQMLKTL